MRPVVTKLSSKVLRDLYALIRDGYFDNSETLPKEEDLAKILQVSRSVIRDVLKTMEQEGYVIRVKKKGTVINRRVFDIKFRMDIEYEFKDLLELARYQHSAEVLEMTEIEADEFLAEKLECAVGEKIYKVVKLVRANGLPVIYCEDFTIESSFKESLNNKNIFRLPVFDQLEKFAGERIDFKLTKLVPCMTPPEIQKYLEDDGVMLMVEEIGFTNKLKPVLFANVYWRGDFFSFQTIRKRY